MIHIPMLVPTTGRSCMSVLRGCCGVHKRPRCRVSACMICASAAATSGRVTPDLLAVCFALAFVFPMAAAAAESAYVRRPHAVKVDFFRELVTELPA